MTTNPIVVAQTCRSDGPASASGMVAWSPVPITVVASADGAYYFSLMAATAADREARDGALNALGASRLGRTFGNRWTLLELLGIGGTACVYAASHRNGARVALKVLHPEFSRDARLRRRFLSEGYAANRVAHPGAVVVLDEAEEDDGTTFLVMELLQGRSLDRALAARGVLPWREVADITIAILDVLAAAHDKHVLHRDIKPSNVFRTDTGQIKLLDFGTAKVHDRPGEQLVTRSGTTLGTPAFMAPELASGSVDDVDALTDVWAVGATMFQLLSGRTVHVARTAHQAIVAAATKPAPPIRTVLPDLPDAIAVIVDRSLAYEKQGRFANARVMQAELRRAVDHVVPSGAIGMDTSPEALPALRVEPRATRTAWVYVALVGALPALGWWAWGTTRDAAARILTHPGHSAADANGRAPAAAASVTSPDASARLTAPHPAPDQAIQPAPTQSSATTRRTESLPRRAAPDPSQSPSVTDVPAAVDTEQLLDRWR